MSKKNLLVLFVLIVAVIGPARAQGPTLQFAHWTFDGGFGSEWPDKHGGWSLFESDTSQSWTPGVFGSALVFDGVDDSLFTGADLSLSAGTLAHWLLADDTATRIAFYNSDSSGAVVYDGFGAGGSALEIHSGSNGNWMFHLQDGVGPSGSNGSYRVEGGPVVPGRWTHVAATWDRAGDLVLYVDCEEVDRVDLSGATWAVRTPDTTLIGKPRENIRHWAGQIDDVRLFDQPLTADEIQTAFCTMRVPDSDTIIDPSGGTGTAYEQIAASSAAVVAGDILSDAHGEGSGRAWVADRESDGTWNAPQNLPATPAADDLLGYDVDIDGTTIVVGAPQTGSTGSGDGYVLLFDRISGTWTQVQMLQASGAPGAEFGSSVSLSGDWLAVGGPGYDGRRGRVWLYQKVAGTWAFVATLDQEVPASGNSFGAAVALHGAELGVLAPGDGLRGSVHFHEHDGASWNLISTLIVQNEWTNRDVTTLTLEDGVAVSGVGGESSRYESQGAMVVFERLGTKGLWDYSDTLFAPDADPADLFGIDVDLRDGQLLALAVPINSPDTGHDNGSAYLWRKTSGVWRTEYFLAPRPPTVFDGVVFGAALLPDVALTGAVFASSGTSGLYVFSLPIFLDGFEAGDASGWSSSLP